MGRVSQVQETRWVHVNVAIQPGVCGGVIKIVFPYSDFPSSSNTLGNQHTRKSYFSIMTQMWAWSCDLFWPLKSEKNGTGYLWVKDLRASTQVTPQVHALCFRDHRSSCWDRTFICLGSWDYDDRVPPPLSTCNEHLMWHSNKHMLSKTIEMLSSVFLFWLSLVCPDCCSVFLGLKLFVEGFFPGTGVDAGT